MRVHEYDLTSLTPPKSWTPFRAALEAALLSYGDSTSELAAAIEQLSADARVAGMRRGAYEAAILDFVSAHDRNGLYPISETVLANALLAASRGFHRVVGRD